MDTEQPSGRFHQLNFWTSPFKVERSHTFANMALSHLNLTQACKLLTVAIPEYKCLNELQSCEMSIYLHRANLPIQILP